MFGFDEEIIAILHKSGKFWHPKGGSAAPKNDTTAVVCSGLYDAAKFDFGDINKNPISPYPEPNLSGDWKLLQAFMTPLADHTYTKTYKVEKSRMDTETDNRAWNVSAKAAILFFSAKAEYSNFVESASSETWSEERRLQELFQSRKVNQCVCGSTCLVWPNMVKSCISTAP